MKNINILSIFLTIEIITHNLLNEVYSASCSLGDDCRDCRNILASCSNCNNQTKFCQTCLPGYFSKIADGNDTNTNPIYFSNCIDPEDIPLDDMIDFQKVVTDQTTSFTSLLSDYKYYLIYFKSESK